jgi:hypothetical protein
MLRQEIGGDLRESRGAAEATQPLAQLANIADRTATEVKRARDAMQKAREAVAPAAALCDIATACRLKGDPLPIFLEDWQKEGPSLPKGEHHQAALKALAQLPRFHFPVSFPEVFLRERSGFDCILGNPPWEKPRMEEHVFWSRYQPKLRGFTQREYEARKVELRAERPDLVEQLDREIQVTDALRSAILSGPFPGMGVGDPDLYKGFAWRFWDLTAKEGGWIGVVLPRSAMISKGSSALRMAMLRGASTVNLSMLINSAGWVFDEAEPRYTIGLCSIRHGNPRERGIALSGPYARLSAYLDGRNKTPAKFSAADVLSWTDTASLPLLPTDESLDVFAQLRKSPRLDHDDGTSWRLRPTTELHATTSKKMLDLTSSTCPRGFWPVYKGESFDIWEPDKHSYYAWADPKPVLDYLQSKRVQSSKLSSSAWAEVPREIRIKKGTLPPYFPRIAFRDVSRNNDARTCRVALVPPHVFIVHLAPFLLVIRGDKRDEAFVLGVLSSIPFDWYARRFVEGHLTYAVLNPLPVPRPPPHSPLAKRVIELAGRLAAVDERYREWAAAVGVECGRLSDDDKQDRIHELDAVVAHLYGLTERHLVHIFETFHEGWDYEARLSATLKHYRAWKARL